MMRAADDPQRSLQRDGIVRKNGLQRGHGTELAEEACDAVHHHCMLDRRDFRGLARRLLRLRVAQDPQRQQRIVQHHTRNIAPGDAILVPAQLLERGERTGEHGHFASAPGAHQFHHVHARAPS